MARIIEVFAILAAIVACLVWAAYTYRNRED